MKARFLNLFNLLLFLCVFESTGAQDYVVNNAGDTLYGKITDCGMKAVKMQLNDKKKKKYDADDIKEYFYEYHSLHCENKKVMNKDRNIFLPVTVRDYLQTSFTENDDRIYITRLDTITLYKIFTKEVGNYYNPRLGGGKVVNTNIHIYVESPFNGLSQLYGPEMTEQDYEDEFIQFKKYFSGKKAVVEKFIYARNENVRRTQTYSFANQLLKDYFGDEVIQDYRF